MRISQLIKATVSTKAKDLIAGVQAARSTEMRISQLIKATVSTKAKDLIARADKGEKVDVVEHGKKVVLSKHSHNNYTLTNTEGRKRWGDRTQIAEDLDYFFETAALPREQSSWA